MAQSSGNSLTIQISADTTKLRADLKLAQSELRDLQKAINKAADQARATGDTTQLMALSKQYEELTAKIRAYNNALADTNKAHVESVQTAQSVAGGFGKINSALQTTIASARLLRGGIISAAVYEGVTRVTKSFEDLAAKVTDLQKITAATGFSTQFIQAFQNILKTTGSDAQKAIKILFSLQQSMDEARLQAERMGSSLGSGVRILRGDTKDLASEMVMLQNSAKTTANAMVTIMRGGSIVAPPEIKDAATAYKALGIDVTKYNNSLEDQKQKVLDVAAGLKRWKDAGRGDVADQIALKTIGDRYREIAAAMDKIGEPGNLDKVMAEMQKTGQMLSDADVKRVNDLSDALDRLNNVKEGIVTSSLLGSLDAELQRVQLETDALKNVVNIPKELKQAFQELGGSLSEGAQRAVNNIQNAFDPLVPWFQNLTRQMSDAWNNTMSTLKVPDSLGSAAIAGAQSGFATGGPVSGPGTGTSDSILGWLSDGEWVMRARAVSYWGPQFMAAINALRNPFSGYSSGGPVHRLPRFAEGGMVKATTGDGTTVNLHFPGGSFALRGDKGIVMGLTREARRAALLSGGRAPGAAVV